MTCFGLLFMRVFEKFIRPLAKCFKFSVLKAVNAFLLFVIFFISGFCVFCHYTWGYVDLPQLLFFIQAEGGTIDTSLFYNLAGWCVLLPLFGTFAVLFLAYKICKEDEVFVDRFIFLLYLCGLWYGVKYYWNLNLNMQFVFSVVLFILYLVNQKRCLNDFSVFVTICLMIPLVVLMVRCLNCTQLFKSWFNMEESKFYAQNYIDVGQPKMQSKGRNVIIVFCESLGKRMLISKMQDLGVRILDEDAVKFTDFKEGYVQNWTQGALFSAFTGVHIHYLSDFYRYRLYDKLKFQNNHKSMLLKITNYFDFDTPNIKYLGDILADNGYQNLFVQGGDMHFTSTDKFLLNHGFLKENVYDFAAFEGTPDYEMAAKNSWWGVSDKSVFQLFKQKISKLDKDTPFFAVMFTMDLHVGDNPFYKTVDEELYALIENLNDFTTWFKKQSFYDNTTLIVLSDHYRAEKSRRAGEELYNAFYNLPDRLSGNLNINRAFNQIDMFPTILEIAGFNLDIRGGVLEGRCLL